MLFMNIKLLYRSYKFVIIELQFKNHIKQLYIYNIYNIQILYNMYNLEFLL